MPPDSPLAASPSPSPAPAPSPAPVAAPVVASPQTPPSPVTTPSPSPAPAAPSPAPAAAARPAYVPESFWDATEGKVKDKEFGEHINGQTARIAADESRRLALPQTPEAYKAELPKDWKAPEGIDFKFDDADPLLSQAKSIMHEIDHGKLSGQEAFSKLLGLYAGVRVGEAAEVATARNAEVAKLGPTGTARVDAVTTFLKATLGDKEGAQIASRMFTADDVQIMEKLVQKFASQGTASFSQQHRDHSTGKVSNEQYEKMNYSEKKEYAAKFPQATH